MAALSSLTALLRHRADARASDDRARPRSRSLTGAGCYSLPLTLAALQPHEQADGCEDERQNQKDFGHAKRHAVMCSRRATSACYRATDARAHR